MFTIGCHNVTDVHNVRIQKGIGEGEGYLTLNFYATSSWTSSGVAKETSNEYTFFFKDLQKGYSSLMESLKKGMDQYHEEQLEKLLVDGEQEANG